MSAMREDPPESGGDKPTHLSLDGHRRLIGVLGFLLPFLLYLVAAARPTDDLPPWKVLGSVSAYYYTGAVGILVGVLFALSLFLLSYPGYEGVWADRVVGWLGGASALGVALFPTKAPGHLSEPSWWRPWMSVVHYLSAIALFGAFILFSLWLFRKSNVALRRDRPPEKRRRNDICLVCGFVMIVCVLWAAIAGLQNVSIFWPESIAILAFAVSWLVKGEMYRPLLRGLRRFTGGAVDTT